MLARVDAQAERLSRRGLLVTRAAVLRLALDYGLERLEAEGKRRARAGA